MGMGPERPERSRRVEGAGLEALSVLSVVEGSKRGLNNAY